MNSKNKALLIFSTILTLLFTISCSSSTSAPESSTTIDGQVADGYLRHAKVFLDCNLNYILDPGELNTMSSNQGKFSFKDIDSAKANCPIVVDASDTEKVVDEDDAKVESGTTNFQTLKVAGRNGFKLSAPKGKHFISPLTTIAHSIGNNVELKDILAKLEIDDQVIANLGMQPEDFLYANFLAYRDSLNNNHDYSNAMHTVAIKNRVLTQILATFQSNSNPSKSCKSENCFKRTEQTLEHFRTIYQEVNQERATPNNKHGMPLITHDKMLQYIQVSSSNLNYKKRSTTVISHAPKPSHLSEGDKKLKEKLEEFIYQTDQKVKQLESIVNTYSNTISITNLMSPASVGHLNYYFNYYINLAILYKSDTLISVLEKQLPSLDYTFDVGPVTGCCRGVHSIISLATWYHPNDTNFLQRIIDGGADLNNPKVDSHQTPLATATTSHRRSTPLTKMLVENGATINLSHIRRPAYYFDIELVKYLMEKGTITNLNDKISIIYSMSESGAIQDLPFKNFIAQQLGEQDLSNSQKVVTLFWILKNIIPKKLYESSRYLFQTNKFDINYYREEEGKTPSRYYRPTLLTHVLYELDYSSSTSNSDRIEVLNFLIEQGAEVNHPRVSSLRFFNTVWNKYYTNGEYWLPSLQNVAEFLKEKGATDYDFKPTNN